MNEILPKRRKPTINNPKLEMKYMYSIFTFIKSNESLNIWYWHVYIVSKVDKWLSAYGRLTSNKKVADSNPAMDIRILTTSVWIIC